MGDASLERRDRMGKKTKTGDLKIVIVGNDEPEILVRSDGETIRIEPAAPDGGFGWVVVFAVFMIHIVMDGMTYSFGVLLSEVLEKFNSSKSEASWIMSVLIGTTYGCGPLPSFLAAKFGRRPVAILGGLIACVGAFSGSYATEVWQLILLYGFVTGLGCGFLYLPAIVSVNHWFEKRRAMAVGIAVCGTGFGQAIFAPFTRYLLDEYGVSGCFTIYAGILLNCCVFASLLRPTPTECRAERRARLLKKTHPLEPLGPLGPLEHQELKELLPVQGKVLVVEGNHPPGEGNRPPVERSRLRVWVIDKTPIGWVGKRLDMELLRQWRFWVYCLTAFFGGISSYIPHAFLPNRAENETDDISAYYAAFLMSGMGIANTVGRLASAAVSDQKWINRMVAYSVCCLVAGMATSFSIYCFNYTTFMSYSVIYGFTGGFIIALQSVVLTDIVGLSKLTAAFGLLLGIEGAAVFVGPPMAGALTDYFDGDYSVAFVITGILMALAGVSLLVIATVNFFVARRGRFPKVVLVE